MNHRPSTPTGVAAFDPNAGSPSLYAPVADGQPSVLLKVVNFAAFQGAWFACVLGAARGWWWAAPAAALVALALHLGLSQSRRAEMGMVVLVALLGLAVDTVLVMSGVVRLRHESFALSTTIVWFASLWVCFATTLNSSLSWLTRLRRWRTSAAALFGGVGGPLAYLAGQRLGAIVLTRGGLSIVILAVEWAIVTPLAVLLARRFAAVGANANRPASATRLAIKGTTGVRG